MNTPHLAEKILLVLGILMLLKSAFAIAKPLAFKQASVWWARVVGKTRFLWGAVCAALALGLWVVVLLGLPVSHWLLLVFGVLYAWGASLCFRPLALQKVMNRMVIERKPGTLRLIFVGVAIVAGILIWVGLTSP